eukprot:776813-Pyramimonas_sp.AAC.1
MVPVSLLLTVRATRALTVQVKWCPAPECVFAVEVSDSTYDAGTPLDIDCSCGHQFCYNCNQEAHRPVDCVTVKR